jgi:hypothetical protein
MGRWGGWGMGFLPIVPLTLANSTSGPLPLARGGLGWGPPPTRLKEGEEGELTHCSLDPH